MTKAILAVILVPALASAADRKPQKTVVLVHGAFADDAASVKRVGIQGIRCAHGRATLELPGARRCHWHSHVL